MSNSMNKKYVEMIKNELLRRLGNESSITITMKSTGDELIIARDCEGYTLYNGCELVVGDTSISFISKLIADGNVRPY